MALGRWAVQWLFDDLRPEEVDAVNLLWWMHRRIDDTQLPDSRVVVEFVHTEPKRTTIWMVLDRGEASVCLQHPGFDPDLVVTTTTPALAEVFSGRRHVVERPPLGCDPHRRAAVPRQAPPAVVPREPLRRCHPGDGQQPRLIG